MQLLVLFKFCRDQMRGDREECGVHSAPPSALHQQPHNGGVYAYQCTPTLLLNLYVCCFGWWLHGWLAFSDLPQVGWLGWGHREVPAPSGFVEEVRLLYFTVRFRSRIGWSHEARRPVQFFWCRAMSCTSLHMLSDDYFWQILTRLLVLYQLHTSRSTS